MRKLLFVSVLMAGTLAGSGPALAQTLSEQWHWCTGSESEVTPDLRISACTAVIQSGKENSKKLAIAFNSRGAAYVEKGDYDRAMEDLDEAIRLNPNFAGAFSNRAAAYARKDDYDHAIEDLDEATRLNPSFALAFMNRGAAYYEKGDYDRAIEDLDEAIQLNPIDSRAFDRRGSAYAKEDDYDRAMKDFEQAIRLNPNDAHVFDSRALAYAHKGDYDPAMKDFEQAIRLNPKYALAFYDRGRAYLSQADYDHAIEDFDQAVRLEPKSSARLRGRGIARVCLGQFQPSEGDLALALQLKPADAYSAIWLYLARTHAGEGAKEELVKDAAGLKLEDWPGPVVELYLGQISRDDLLDKASSGGTSKEKEQVCEADFFLGEYLLAHGDQAEGQRLLREAMATGEYMDYAYSGAQAELARLTVQSPSR
jgi:lipoprotein NlpI